MNLSTPIAWLKGQIPSSVRPTVRQIYYGLRRPFRTAKRNIAAEPISRERLIADIRELGLRSGDGVIVHSSLSKLGYVVDGPEGVIQALLAVVGSRGMVVMPSYSVDRPVLDYLATDPLFDPDQTPSLMGKITETFRTWPGTARSSHPTHPLSALGPDALDLVRDHWRSITAFGPDTPFRHLWERNVWILGLGVDLGPMTFYHVFEDMMDPFPLPVYFPELQTARVLVDGVEHTVKTKVHNPKIQPYRIDKDTQVRAVVTRKLSEFGYLSQRKVGEGSSYVIKSRDLITGLERMLAEGITIYNTERMQNDGWTVPGELATRMPI